MATVITVISGQPAREPLADHIARTAREISMYRHFAAMDGMSGWRIALTALYDCGGTAGGSLIGTRSEISRLQQLGLVRRWWPRTLHAVAYSRRRLCDPLWQITPLGLDVAERRVMQICIRPGGRRWVATWLAALPLPADHDQRAARCRVMEAHE